MPREAVDIGAPDAPALEHSAGMRTVGAAFLTLLAAALLQTGNAQLGTAMVPNTTAAVGGLSYVRYSDYNSLAVTIEAVSYESACKNGAPAYPLVEATIEGVHAAMLAGNLTCSQLVKGYLQRISAYDKITMLNSVQSIDPNIEAVAAAKDAELTGYLANGTALPPLFCVPILFKDNYDAVGMPNTAGAVALLDNFPNTDSTMVAQVKAQGGVVLGKSNLCEWAQSAVYSIGSAFGVVRNAYDLDRTAGGSSGGPASAAAANLALLTFGSDTGSSIRTPAAAAHLVGIRPTIGLTSRAGIIPLNYFRDTGGPIGRTVRDVATAFGAVASNQYDPRDPLTALSANVTVPSSYTQFLDANGLKGKTVAVMDYLATRTGYDSEILAIFNQAVADIEALGATVIRNVTIKGNALGDKDFDPNQFQSWPTGFGNSSKFESLGGSCGDFVPALEDYLATATTKYKTGAKIFYDGLIHPVSATAFSNDLKNPNRTATYPPPNSGLICNCKSYVDDPCGAEFRKRFIQALDDNNATITIYPVQLGAPPHIGDFNAYFARNTYMSPSTGAPAIAVPMGASKGGLPTGLMMMARPFDEAALFTAAYAYEQKTKHRVPSKIFPECINGKPFVSYTSVLQANERAIGAPVTAPAPAPAVSVVSA
ncbi:hypothetical protein WJX72_007874 [[Myrmecia] bisecta]|uniref:Amidase domain-containing protein n=1 Tax=[Myrmecia] bisecta TaxID=41462 RepID=A0AAW1R895_9CHLO